MPPGRIFKFGGGKEADLVDFTFLEIEWSGEFYAENPDIFRFDFIPDLTVEKVNKFNISGNAEFFGKFPAGGSFKIFSGVKVSADGGIPLAGLDILIHASFLQQHSAGDRVADDNMSRAVNESGITVTFTARGDSEVVSRLVVDIEILCHLFLFTDDSEQFVAFFGHKFRGIGFDDEPQERFGI